MDHAVTLTPAYVLHRRLFRDTSFIVEFFTRDYGRLSLIAKGIRKQGSTWPGLLQPFVPLLISWVGKSELKTLTQIELSNVVPRLQADNLIAGLYLNELVMALLPKWDMQLAIYHEYERAIDALAKPLLTEHILRIFEKRLIEALGYAPLTQVDAEYLQTDDYYQLTQDQGFIKVNESIVLVDKEHAITYFKGSVLQAIAKEHFEVDGVLKDAKRLMRLVLMSLLGSKQINSRALFLR